MAASRQKLMLVVRQAGNDYFATSTIHGFAYWVAGKSAIERVFWFIVSLAGFTCAGFFLRDVILEWKYHPIDVSVETFSLPVSQLPFPALTICKKRKYDVGEYIRAVFNNFEPACEGGYDSADCNETEPLRSHYMTFLSEREFVPEVGMKGFSLPIGLGGNIARWTENAATQYNPEEVLPSCAKNPRKTYCNAFTRFAYPLLPYKFSKFEDCPGYLFQDDQFDNCFRKGYGLKRTVDKNDIRLLSLFADALLSGSCKPFHAEDKYRALCKIIFDKALRGLWAGLNTCWILEKSKNSAGRDVRQYNETCLGSFGANGTVIKDFQRLSHLDATVIKRTEEILARVGKAMDPFEVFFSFAPGFKFLKIFPDYCTKRPGRCPDYLWLDLARKVLLLKFLQGIRLPEHDLGTMFSSIFSFTSFLNGTLFPTTIMSSEGWLTFVQALFGEDTPSKHISSMKWPPQFHPAFVAEQFDADPFEVVPAYLNFTDAHGGLAKLLMFGRYARGVSRNRNVSVKAILEQELDKYPYKRRLYRAPYFSPLDIRGEYEDLFFPAVTDSGICDVFNGDSFGNTFRPTVGPTVFKSFLPNRGPITPMHFKTEGYERGMMFMFNIGDRSLRSKVFQFPKTKNTALVAINDWLTYYTVHENAHEITPGQKTVLTIQPKSFVASERFRKLDINVRKCRFPDELEDENSIFTQYNKKSCEFECRLNYAIEQAQCIPWDMPKTSELPVCTSAENKDGPLQVFYKAMVNDSLLPVCDCLPNCEETDYDLKVYVADFKPQEICNIHEWSNVLLAMADWEKTNSPMVYWFEQLREDHYLQRFKSVKLLSDEDPYLDEFFSPNISFGLPTSEAIRVCRERFRTEFAILEVRLDKNVATRIKKDVKITFASQVAAIGGTLGLFTGISIISLVEVGFWIAKTVIRVWTGQDTGH